MSRTDVAGAASAETSHERADPTRRGGVGVVVLRVVPLVGVAGTVLLWWVWPRGYWGVVGEDRLAEWLTFAAYSVAGVLAVRLAFELKRQGCLAEAALMLLFASAAALIAGEEVSWFQRQLGFDGPEALVERNNQGEANLHNLLGRHLLHGSFIVVGLYGAIGAHLLVPRIPLLRDRPWLYVPPRSLVVWFSCAWVYYAWADYLDPVLVRLFGDSFGIQHLTGPKLQEAVELALAGAVALHVARLVLARGPIAGSAGRRSTRRDVGLAGGGRRTASGASALDGHAQAVSASPSRR